MNINQHLNAIFEEGAKQELKNRENKIFSYKMYSGILERTLTHEGKCIVKNIQYNTCLDCDIYTIEDIKTGKILSCNQFNIKLCELKNNKLI